MRRRAYDTTKLRETGGGSNSENRLIRERERVDAAEQTQTPVEIRSMFLSANCSDADHSVCVCVF